jgi:hypothetical protein
VLLSRLSEIDIDPFFWLKKRRRPSPLDAHGSRRHPNRLSVFSPLTFVGLADHSINLRSNLSFLSPSGMLAWRAFFRRVDPQDELGQCAVAQSKSVSRGEGKARRGPARNGTG